MEHLEKILTIQLSATQSSHSNIHFPLTQGDLETMRAQMNARLAPKSAKATGTCSGRSRTGAPHEFFENRCASVAPCQKLSRMAFVVH